MPWHEICHGILKLKSICGQAAKSAYKAWTCSNSVIVRLMNGICLYEILVLWLVKVRKMFH